MITNKEWVVNLIEEGLRKIHDTHSAVAINKIEKVVIINEKVIGNVTFFRSDIIEDIDERK